MNPLQRLNLRHEAKKNRRLRLVAVLFLALLLSGAVVYKMYTQPAPITVVEVSEDVADVRELSIVAATFDEIFGSVASVSSKAATIEVPKQVQTARIRLNANSFKDSVASVEGAQMLSYALVQKSGDVKKPQPQPQVRQAIHLPEPPVAVKPEPKKPVAPPVQPKVRLSSDNWPHMTPLQKWQFSEAFVKSKGWKCPPSGHPKEWEMQQLQEHGWQTVYNFGFNNCVKPDNGTIAQLPG